MFIEHGSRMLEESAVDFYRDIKEEKVKERTMTIASAVGHGSVTEA